MLFFADVLGLEQFKLGHDNGGSQDLSRVVYANDHTFFQHFG